MFRRYVVPALVVAMLAAQSAAPADARGGGGGGGGGGSFSGGGGNSGGGGHSGGSNRSGDDRSGWGFGIQRSAQDQQLFERARHDCNGPWYPSGATMQINYGAGTYRCVEGSQSK